MITSISVENIAIIERAEVHFAAGFTVLSGETGAGKSLLIDAIQLCLGERADTELVRTGCTKATAQMVVRLEPSVAMQAMLDENGIELDDSQLFISRDVFSEGRSVARINGRQVPVATLKSIGKMLVDLHGQHQHQGLLDPTSHVEYLDAWIGAEAFALREKIREEFEAWSAARSQLAALRKGVQEREQRLDMLRFQVKEIEDFDVQADEENVLNGQINRLKNSEKLVILVRQALAALTEEESNARDLAASAEKAVSDIERLDSTLSSSKLTDAVVLLEEAILELHAYAEQIESDPDQLDELANRLDHLRRLKRKYGESEIAILAFLEEARAELLLLEDAEAGEASLVARETETRGQLAKTCGLLTALRRQHAEGFAGEVRNHLRDLSMGRAELEVKMEECEPTSEGADLVEFLFSANLGEDLKPLAKIASGGEISRVMLAIKSVIAGRIGVPSIIFDEVDSGLGGAAAAAVGRKIRALSEHFQILAVSHVPQVASAANHQFRIHKSEVGGRARTEIEALSQEERVEEIARMLAGERISDTAIANAKELLSFL